VAVGHGCSVIHRLWTSDAELWNPAPVLIDGIGPVTPLWRAPIGSYDRISTLDLRLASVDASSGLLWTPPSLGTGGRTYLRWIGVGGATRVSRGTSQAHPSAGDGRRPRLWGRRSSKEAGSGDLGLATPERAPGYACSVNYVLLKVMSVPSSGPGRKERPDEFFRHRMAV